MNLARAARLTKPRRIIIAAVLAAATVLPFFGQAASARPDGPRALHGNVGTKPVIVLVHGAWADASSWARTGATGGVIPSRTMPASPAATRRTAPTGP
jgi:hypothetical protein